MSSCSSVASPLSSLLTPIQVIMPRNDFFRGRFPGSLKNRTHFVISRFGIGVGSVEADPHLFGGYPQAGDERDDARLSFYRRSGYHRFRNRDRERSLPKGTRLDRKQLRDPGRLLHPRKRNYW